MVGNFDTTSTSCNGLSGFLMSFSICFQDTGLVRIVLDHVPPSILCESINILYISIS